MRAVMEGDAFRLHLRDTAVDQMLFHLEIGNAVTQKPAGLGVLFKEMNFMSRARQLLRGRKAGWPGANHRNLLARAFSGDQRLYPAILPRLVDDGTFDRLDGDRRVIDIERARGFARRGAHAAGELREVVGGME